MLARFLFLVPAALLPLAALGACKANADASATTTPSSQPTYVPPPTTAPPPTAAPTAAPVATSTGPATPIAPVAAAAMGPILTSMGQNEAPGASADGSPFAGQFAAGQTLEQVINIKGNGCYTIVATGLGIQQLDITLVVQPAPQLPPYTVATSQSQGPTAILGGKATGCWRNPTPLAGQGKVILRATAGAGLAAAQVLSK